MQTPKIDTASLIPLVRAYLVARAFAETKRAQVDAIKQQVLDSATYYVAHEKSARRGERVTDPRNDWLMASEEFADYAAEVNRRALAEGVKPQDMPEGYCPALVAEEVQRQAERLLIEASGKSFGITNDKLLCGGLEKRQEWIDLVIKLVVSTHPKANFTVTL